MGADEKIIPSSDAFELVFDRALVRKTKEIDSKRRASMHNPRYCFGYTTFELGRFIITVGGAVAAYDQTKLCEFYDVNKD